MSSSKLDGEMGQNKLLTVKFPEKTLAEFHAASEILGARTTSALVHQFALQKIREAKNLSSQEEFDAVYQNKLTELQNRSREKKEQSASSTPKPNNVAYFPLKGSEIQELGSSNNFSDDEGKFKNYSLDPPDGEIDPILEEEIKKIEARRKATGKDDSED